MHVCDQCSRAFSRAEHLERHQTTHLPSNATKSFVCSSCSKGFTRKDVLTRHIRAVHETKKSEVRKSRRKSCRRCAAFKIKCTSGSKGKQSGDRAAEPCEACRKRDVECIFDFGVTVDRSESQEQGNAEEMFDFGSDDGHSDPETTGSSEYSLKRRKIAHHAGSSGTAPIFLSSSGSGSAQAVSPLLLSAARLASQTTQTERQSDLLPHLGGSSAMHAPPLELSSADHLLSMATFANKGMHIPNSVEHRGFLDPPRPPVSRPASMGPGQNGQGAFCGGDFMSHLYFPPIRDPSAQIPRQETKGNGNGGMLNRIAEEDLNAANTLQGVNIRPIDMAGVLPRHYSTDYSHTSSVGGFPRSPVFNGGGISLAPLHQTNQDIKSIGTLDDPGGLDPGLELVDEDNFYFDFGIFDNSTDWLRDWGPNESISPESQPGREALEALPDVAFGLGLTPGNYNGDIAGVTPTTSNARDEPVGPAPPPPAPPVSSPSPPATEDNRAALTSAPSKVGEDAGVHVPGLPTVSPMKDHVNSTDFLPWGWQQGLREEPSRKVTLPPLRQVLTERHSDSHSGFLGQQPVSDLSILDKATTVTEQMRRAMIEVLTLPSSQPPYPGCEIAEIEKGFPGTDIIATFIGLYFENFHPILPVIHRPTFSIEKTPSILLIAIVSIGASYSNLKNANTFADSLSELCKRCLAWMAENNPAYGRSPFFLMSMCLQNLYAIGCGSTSLYDAADVSRSIIIGNARRIGLFSGAINTSPTSSSPSSAPGSPALRPANGRNDRNLTPQDRERQESPSLLDSRWREWIEKEGLKRLAWGIFEYDSSFSTLSNRRGAISISDVTIRIPCSESLWNAPDAVTWNARLRHEPEIRGFAFYPTIKGILLGRFDAKMLTSWGKRLCAQAMGRIMWDFKELEESVLSVGSVGAASFKPQKELLLRSAMRVCESATPRADEAEGDRYHWILARLIAHYTHLHAAFPTISLMLNLARKPPPQSVGNNDPRIKRLKNTFITDPIGARALAWHAAQIIALSRWKPVFSPVEGMRLFLAGVVLWTYAQYRRPREETPASSCASSVKSGAYPLATASRHEEVVRLDLLPWNMPSSSSSRVEEWLRYGIGRGSIGMGMGDDGPVMEVCGEDGAREVLKVVVGILGSLRVWGLGGEFKNVLEELMSRSHRG